MREEVLLAEHRELVEFYKHHWANILYFGVSYILINGAAGSIYGVCWTIQPTIPTSYMVGISLIGLAVVIVAYTVFVISIRRTQVELLSIIDKAIAIEEALQNASLPLDTFKSCVVAFEKRRFQLLYIVPSIVVSLWILIGIVVFFYLGL